MKRKMVIGSLFVLLLLLLMPLISVQANNQEIKETNDEPTLKPAMGLFARIRSSGKASVTWGPGKIFFWVHYLDRTAMTSINPLIGSKFTLEGTHCIGCTLFLGSKSWGPLGAINEEVSFNGFAFAWERKLA